MKACLKELRSCKRKKRQLAGEADSDCEEEEGVPGEVAENGCRKVHVSHREKKELLVDCLMTDLELELSTRTLVMSTYRTMCPCLVFSFFFNGYMSNYLEKDGCTYQSAIIPKIPPPIKAQCLHFQPKVII